MSSGQVSVSDHGDPSLDAFAAGFVARAQSPTRLRFDVSYDGTSFSGWATQPERRTVQGVLQDALSTVLRLPSVALTVAGRTDAGVHATGQVAHADVPSEMWAATGATLVRRLDGVLPPDVRVFAVSAVPPQFDARFGALWRRYEYRICDREAGVEPLRRHFVLGWHRRLDAAAMGEAAATLLGLHDFVAFCKWRDTGTTIRTLERFDVHRDGEEIVCTVQADAFCHSMVRSLVGALLAVGDGRRRIDWPAGLLGRNTRADDVSVVPAYGLTLTAVGYPPAEQLATRATQTRSRRG
jgi:tRNA pseudouridine38-40 synthase